MPKTYHYNKNTPTINTERSFILSDINYFPYNPNAVRPTYSEIDERMRANPKLRLGAKR